MNERMMISVVRHLQRTSSRPLLIRTMSGAASSPSPPPGLAEKQVTLKSDGQVINYVQVREGITVERLVLLSTTLSTSSSAGWLRPPQDPPPARGTGHRRRRLPHPAAPGDGPGRFRKLHRPGLGSAWLRKVSAACQNLAQGLPGQGRGRRGRVHQDCVSVLIYHNV